VNYLKEGSLLVSSVHLNHTHLQSSTHKSLQICLPISSSTARRSSTRPFKSRANTSSSTATRESLPPRLKSENHISIPGLIFADIEIRYAKKFSSTTKSCMVDISKQANARVRLLTGNAVKYWLTHHSRSTSASPRLPPLSCTVMASS